MLRFAGLFRGLFSQGVSWGVRVFRFAGLFRGLFRWLFHEVVCCVFSGVFRRVVSRGGSWDVSWGDSWCCLNVVSEWSVACFLGCFRGWFGGVREWFAWCFVGCFAVGCFVG